MAGCGEGACGDCGNDALATGNVEPLLNEIRHALQTLLATGETTTIDLRSLPLAPGEEERMMEVLGRGEVQASVSALGPTEIAETRFPGAWVITHYNTEKSVIGKFVEICEVPGLLCSQHDDIRQAIGQLQSLLD